MYNISPSVTIDASPEGVWAILVDVEEWWVASTPGHESLEIVSGDEVLAAGTAYYPLLRGLVTVRIPEGGTIRLEETEDGTRMSHAVWMDFPNNRRGRLLKPLFTTVLDGKAKLYDHTNKELVFFKERIESTANESPKPTDESP